MAAVIYVRDTIGISKYQEKTSMIEISTEDMFVYIINKPKIMRKK